MGTPSIKYYHIYKITNIINNKCYVGSAVNIADRWNLHRKSLKNGTHHSIKLQRAWDKYGEGNFIFEILDVTNSKKRLIPDEQYWIDMYDSAVSGYNVSPTAGSQLGFRHSEKTKLYISLIQKGRVSNRKGAKLSDSTKEKLRQANLGKITPEYVKEKLRGRRYKMTDVNKRKISEARGRKNYYTILFENGISRELNYFRDYCDRHVIGFSRLHSWSKENINNNRVHPKFKLKILKLTIR